MTVSCSCITKVRTHFMAASAVGDKSNLSYCFLFIVRSKSIISKHFPLLASPPPGPQATGSGVIDGHLYECSTHRQVQAVHQKCTSQTSFPPLARCRQQLQFDRPSRALVIRILIFLQAHISITSANKFIMRISCWYLELASEEAQKFLSRDASDQCSISVRWPIATVMQI